MDSGSQKVATSKYGTELTPEIGYLNIAKIIDY